MYHSYCICVIHHWPPLSSTGARAVLDRQTFPNPEKDKTAERRCKDKAKYIRELLATKNGDAMRAVLGIPNTNEFRVEAIHYRQLVEE